MITTESNGVTLVGFSMGGGEVVRYLGARGSRRVRSAVLAGAGRRTSSRPPTTPTVASTTTRSRA